jgi:predicted nucleotidyltransferase component of viral defense system
VIAKQELLRLRGEWQLDVGVIEKDYVLGWVLAAIAAEPALAGSWVFKGGTCLRKCYYETYRFSEDLDFTVVDGGPEEPGELAGIFARISAWLARESGIELAIDDRTFVRRRNLRGRSTTQARITYRGPNPSRGTSPKLKLDLTADEVLVQRPLVRAIVHPYGDAPLPGGGVVCYSPTELLAEKTRALAERCRPRDLYDIVHMHRHPDLIGRAPLVRSVLAAKCAHAGIAVPDAEAIRASPHAQEIEREWENMLGHQLPRPLPPFRTFWDALEEVFAWLAGTQARPVLRRIRSRDALDSWRPPRAIHSWRRGAPLELIRYAGANRLKVEIDYHPEQGEPGWRLVEPYELRRTQAGKLVLLAVNSQGGTRTYRIDRIARIRSTDMPFRPRYIVAF